MLNPLEKPQTCMGVGDQLYFQGRTHSPGCTRVLIRAMPAPGSGHVSTAALCSPSGSLCLAAPCPGGASPWKAAALLPSHFPFSQLSTLGRYF